MKSDVVTVIRDHHEMIERLTRSLTVVELSPSQRRMFDEFAKGVGALVRALDESVIPLLKQHGWTYVSSQLLREHVGLKQQLGDLLTVPQGDRSAFALAFAHFVAKLEQQRQLAAQQLYPWLEKNLTEHQRLQVGMEVQGHFHALLGDERRDFDESEPASALLEEAKLVLGSLPKSA